MEEIRPFIGAVALWIGISCGLWWLHRRRVRGRQNRQLEQARRAALYAGEAQAVFDAIRSPVPLEDPPAETGAWLRAETHALLKRLREHGPFFDKLKTLRVQIQSSLAIDDHEPLSELLNLRRDLWAASEVVLVEDPGSFGATFAEEGAYERFQAEALTLLFKRPDRSADDDLIDLRLSLARQEAGRFTAELEEAIAIAREQDRLPTLSEIVAYPLPFLRAIPRALRTAGAFLRAFFGYALDAARAIRRSQTMARGASRLREAREDWPQRLSGGFEHVSAAARESTTAIRRHYDFLVAAHDFQAKYERLVRAAPEITERGRQFIARLELAERSERLRLTSANAAIWLARGLLSGLAHLLAGIARLLTALRETAPWGLAAALLRPAPLAGRRRSTLRSYSMALAAGGLSETPFNRHWRLAPPAAQPEAASGGVRPEQEKAAKAPSRSLLTMFKRRARPAAGKSIEIETLPAAPSAPRPIGASQPQAAVSSREDPAKIEAVAALESVAPEPLADDSALRDGEAPPRRRPSFLKRLFGKSMPEKANAAHSDPQTDHAVRAVSPPQIDPTPEAGPAVQAEAPPKLMDKLSSLEGAEHETDGKGDAEHEEEPAAAALPKAEQDDDTDDPGPLTLSILELQSRIKPKEPQIRSFPWLRE